MNSRRVTRSPHRRWRGAADKIRMLSALAVLRIEYRWAENIPIRSSVPKRFDLIRSAGETLDVEKSDHWHRRLLRARREWPCGRTESSMMNSRRFIQSPRRSGRAASKALRTRVPWRSSSLMTRSYLLSQAVLLFRSEHEAERVRPCRKTFPIVFLARREQILALVRRYSLPAMYPSGNSQ
jgi:hypothetical protein